MSNFADLARADKFIGQPVGPTNRLKKHAFLSVAAIALIAGGGFFFLHSHSGDAAVPTVQALPVTALSLRPQTVQPSAQFSGRINAVDYAEIRPQVGGRITEIRFHDGQQVKAGDILFVIDPRPYQAAAAKAEGDLASAINNAKLAKIEHDRGDRLMKAGALAQESFDQRANGDGVAQAAVQSARAALAAAQINIDYAYIKAPISGRISRAEITLGNLVGATASAPPVLASIVSENGVYADFEVDEQTYLNNVRNHAQTLDQQAQIPVDLQIEGDSGHVYRGTIESFDNRINTGSGTIRARARFDNKDGSLVPGMFVSVKMGGGTLNNAIMIPESAIGNDQSKRFVFVVNRDSKAEYRQISLGAEVDGARIVTNGVKAGDRVILDGLQRLAPGVPVDAKPRQQTASN
ncbi:MAG: efflux RND transporter periplasmic adaptor subunit [Rhizomicrobium sp.]